MSRLTLANPSGSNRGIGGPSSSSDTPALPTPAGRRPQVCPTWMSKEEFEVCRTDPYRAFDAAQQKIRELQQHVTVSRNINRTLIADPKYQFGQAVQNFERLKKEHIQLNDAYNDLESVHETLQEVTEVLRGDKHQLLVELNAVKREVMIQKIENTQVDLKTKQLHAFLDSVDLKLASQEHQLGTLDEDERAASKQLVEVRAEITALEATCQNLSLQSSSLSDLRQHLDTTRVSQDRAISSLEREVQGKAQEMLQHDAQLWEFKRDMSARILALQKKAQEAQDELLRLHRLSEHEINTLAAQNRALNDELKSTADALFATRKEKTDFSTAAKREIHQRKEEVQQCLSVLDLVERQNQGLEASILRMMEQNKLSERQIAEKDNINNKNVIEQSNFISMLHMDLQSTREDLYILKARLCHSCRDTILSPEELQMQEQQAYPSSGSGNNMGQTQMPNQQQQQQRPNNNNAGGGGGGSSLVPLEFDEHGLPAIHDAEKERLDADLRRTKEALEAVNRQLLEERAARERERREDEQLRQQEEEDRQAKLVEEEARRHRAKDDERKLAAGEEAFTYTVRFVDGTRKKIDAFPSDLVRDVIARVCSKAGIRFTDLFYLAHAVNESSVIGAVDRFLDRNRTLEQEGVTPKSNLVFKLKHYKRHRQWTDVVAQEWYFRQIHQQVVSEYYPTHERLAVELASYEIQSVFGDYSGKKRHSYFDRVGLDSYLPVSVSAHEYEYWQERLFLLHKKRKGLSAIEARTMYIDTFASSSPYWGMTFFDIRDRENRPFLAGIAEDGLYILSASKREVLATLRFSDLLGWERSHNGIFVKKKGSSKMTLYGSSKLQSKEMVDLLNEYYLMLPQDVRDQLGIAVDDAEQLRARLPSWRLFDNAIAHRRRPIDFASRLEHFKASYMAHCLEPDEQGKKRDPITKLTTIIDRALDNKVNLTDFDLSNCQPPLDDWHWKLLVEVLQYTLEQYTPIDAEQWMENIDLRRLDLSHSTQQLTQHCLPNVCMFIRKFRFLTRINLSNIPLDTGRDITAALVTLGDLDTLILKNCKIHPRCFQQLLLLFGMQPSKLRVLDVEHNTINHSSVTQLCEFLKAENCSLTELNCGNNKIEGTGLVTLMEALRYKRRLRVLNFGGNPGGEGQASKFADLIQNRVGLTELCIPSCSIKGVQAVRLSQELKDNGEIKKLDLSHNPVGEGLTRQRQSGSGEITRDYPGEFFSFLDNSSHSAVETLIMEKCSLEEEAGSALAAVLANNTKLKELILRDNFLAKNNYHLPPSWGDMFKNNHTLSKLDLSSNFLGYQGLKQLFSHLLRNRTITELTLDGNTMSQYPPNTDHVELVSFLENNNTVQMLSMSSMQLHDDILVRIGEGLRRNRTLQKLLLQNNEFTVRGVGEFSRSLPENTTLQYLDLSCMSVQVSDDLYLQAYKALIESGNLETALL